PTKRRRPRNEEAPRRELLRSPSRSRFRPPFSLTFGFRLRPSSSASSYFRSVLGARGNLGAGSSPHKRSRKEKPRNLGARRWGAAASGSLGRRLGGQEACDEGEGLAPLTEPVFPPSKSPEARRWPVANS